MPCTTGRESSPWSFPVLWGGWLLSLLCSHPDPAGDRDLPQEDFTSGEGLWYRAVLQSSPLPPFFCNVGSDLSVYQIPVPHPYFLGCISTF